MWQFSCSGVTNISWHLGHFLLVRPFSGRSSAFLDPTETSLQVIINIDFEVLLHVKSDYKQHYYDFSCQRNLPKSSLIFFASLSVCWFGSSSRLAKIWSTWQKCICALVTSSWLCCKSATAKTSHFQKLPFLVLLPITGTEIAWGVCGLGRLTCVWLDCAEYRAGVWTLDSVTMLLLICCTWGLWTTPGKTVGARWKSCCWPAGRKNQKLWVSWRSETINEAWFYYLRN